MEVDPLFLLKKINGGARNSAETFGFLALTSFGSYNTVYAAPLSLRPNCPFGATSHTPKTLSENSLIGEERK